MPSTYTTSLGLTLPATGELSGTWGTTVNTGITSLVDDSVAGTAAITMVAADYTLSTTQGASNEARKMFITATGTPGAARNIIVPAVSKLYFVFNNTTGGFAQTVKTATGTGVSVANGARMVLYCNGTDVVDALTALGAVTLSAGTANGVTYLNGSKVLTSGSALTFNGTDLSVAGGSYTGTKFSIGSEGSGSLYLTTGYFRIANAGGETLRIDASGNVGIGTSSPAQILDVTKSQNAGTVAIVRNSNAGALAAAQLVVNADTATGRFAAYSSGAGALANYVSIEQTTNNPIVFYTNSSERMRVDGSGNVGIGTASPGALFDVGGGGLRVASTGAITSSDLADAVGYKGVPINSQSANYTLVMGDQGKTILHPIADNNPRTFTIPANGTVAYPVGTVVTFINLINTVTIAITTDTMYLAGTGSTGSRTLGPYGVATAVKVTSTSWIISGNGLT